MITFICCSINPQYAEKLRANIETTIGNIPFEFIAFDNRKAKLGICEVYNSGAEKSMYNNLCFLHEDVKFITEHWGAEIINKLSEDDCGVIGFAGSAIKMNFPSGWCLNSSNTRHHYIQHYNNPNKIKKTSTKRNNPDKLPYSEVITLDGLALFMSKRVWTECKFSQEFLTGFHCYDIDITLKTATKGYKNYVTNRLLIEHFSEGSFSETWRSETLRVHDRWKHLLPLYASSLTESYITRHAPKAYYNSIKEMVKSQLYIDHEPANILKHMLKHPFNISSWKLIKYYLKYNSNYKSNR